MATPNTLESAVDLLADDLQKLKQTLHTSDLGCFITHDDVDTIIVYTTYNVKAYVPKTYNGWFVEFQLWDGKTFDFKLDIDREIE